MNYDVIIIGSGAGGSAAAYQLTQMDHRVLLLERGMPLPRDGSTLDVVKLRGAPAWWLWGAIHVGFLVGLRNRISVMFDWFWAYLTYRSGTRLITGLPVNESTVAAVSETPPRVIQAVSR